MKPVESSSKKKWSVRVKDLEKNQVTEEIFDAVLVCNGHYFQPNYANIKGKDVFKGQQLHAHDYRVPDIFANKNVVVIGAGPSGIVKKKEKKCVNFLINDFVLYQLIIVTVSGRRYGFGPGNIRQCKECNSESPSQGSNSHSVSC